MERRHLPNLVNLGNGRPRNKAQGACVSTTRITCDAADRTTCSCTLRRGSVFPRCSYIGLVPITMRTLELSIPCYCFLPEFLKFQSLRYKECCSSCFLGMECPQAIILLILASFPCFIIVAYTSLHATDSCIIESHYFSSD